MGIGKKITIQYCNIWATIQYYCDFAIQQILRLDSAILRFMFPILFKGITKKLENKTDQLTLNVTFNSVNNIIY